VSAALTDRLLLDTARLPPARGIPLLLLLLAAVVPLLAS
jgi:hypothetical protein